MESLVSNLLSNNLVEARNELESKIKSLVEEKLNQIKLRISAEFFDELTEANVLKIGRTKLVKVRIRRGKIQRRKRLSATKGYTIRKGQMTRMMPAERRHREISSKRSMFKRRAKIRQTVRKRRISLRKRTSLGV